ncbi:hypothetical protein FA15DRAFT_669566 [Coprinopsis marcescibilis]|uniref:Transmembrane protein n=1 Tax=Coprinopsis marcescibilis TaxID=230819 RepID=A0A5C3KW74_COPMA|nr:hypothetical protein FA15DRAFT_669566 [Coprinopsis marcescibilis]
MMDSFIILLGAGVLAFLVPGASAEEVCKTNTNGEETCSQGESTTEQAKLPGGLPSAAKAAIVVVSITVVFLCLTMFFCIRRSRRQSEAAQEDVMVEASQVTGPPAILAATYTPGTGHSRVYSIGPDTGGLQSAVPVPLTPAPAANVVPPSALRNVWAETPAGAHGTPPMGTTAPALASAAVAAPVVASASRPSIFSRWGITKAPAEGSQPQSAPAHKANFDQSTYPFTGFGSSSNSSGDNANSNTQPRSAFVSNGGFPRPLLAGRLKDRIRDRPPSISSVSNERIGSAKY